jgi:hypothetical protein
MHVFPQLRKLEQKYPQELVVIGVHSPKFPAERETGALRKAVMRHDIRHPVVNDRDHLVWRHYACRAWPTLYVIDPEGKVLGRHEGEMAAEEFDQVIAEMVQEFDGRGLMDRRSLSFQLEREAASPLSFPGKLLADAASGRLFIADSGHHRLLVATLEGRVQLAIGGPEPGFRDGGFGTARFQSPQGLALAGEHLYVADTENHAVRRADLARGTVETVAGTGAQGLTHHGGGPGPESSLSSPWDLALHESRLYIAMAGFHQLWALDLADGRVSPYAGSGREEIADGPLASACLAQPSGVAVGDGVLYFADSETSSIRSAGLDPGAAVRTIVGRGLFEFGDRDGAEEQARLQHPLGVAWHDGLLYAADTYNNKIKRVYPRTRSALTFLGDGTPGHRDGAGDQARFHDPGGLSVAGGKLYIADTNNHAVRVAELESGRVETLNVRED